MVFFAGVLMLPMLADGVGCFGEPGTVFGSFQNVGSRKILCAVLRGIADAKGFGVFAGATAAAIRTGGNRWQMDMA
jgi:hypothetical protein